MILSILMLWRAVLFALGVGECAALNPSDVLCRPGEDYYQIVIVAPRATAPMVSQ